MTRALLLACRHRIANDDMALGREPSPMLAEIDAELSGPKAAEGAHTPGSWGVEFDDFDDAWHVTPDGLDPSLTGSLAPVCVVDGPGNDNEANARLIAAAPTLLAALEPFARTADEWHGDEPDETRVGELGESCITLGHCRAARSAYRKAKGGAA